MNIVVTGKKKYLVAFTLAILLPLSAMADQKFDQLQHQVEAMQIQLEKVQEALKQYEEQNTGNVELAREVAVLREEVAQEVTNVKTDLAQAAEWKDPNTLIHMAGYADVGYSDTTTSDGSFGFGQFSPIFHFQYRDLVMLEAELEFEVGDNGETEVGIEYMTIDLFANDWLTLVGGRFLSPIGQFRQNLHPSWINKLTSAPPGFGHDGAAPTSEMGLQARGGFQLGSIFANYAAYVGNGPELNATLEDGEFELEGVVAEGFGKDNDGKKVFGGRFGFLPLPELEIGISAATGKTSVTALELAQDVADPGFDLSNESARDYDVYGFDFAWGLSNFRLRGEYVKTKIGADDVGITASPGASWESWYTQAAYLIPRTKWEPVLRYADFDSPEPSQDQKQWAMGLNYLFSGSVIGKFSYELNDSEAQSNRWMFQLAYGF